LFIVYLDDRDLANGQPVRQIPGDQTVSAAFWLASASSFHGGAHFVGGVKVHRPVPGMWQRRRKSAQQSNMMTQMDFTVNLWRVLG
jgi:hypothetical protein